MVALAFSELADRLRERQRFGKVLEAEDAVEVRDVLLSRRLSLGLERRLTEAAPLRARIEVAPLCAGGEPEGPFVPPEVRHRI